MAAGRTETIKRDLGLIFLGDWHPVLRDPLDLFRLSFVVGAGIFALQGDWDAAVRLLFPALAVLAVRALNIPRPIDWIFNIAMFFQGWGNALHLFEDFWWYDNTVHITLPMSLAPILYIAFARIDIVPDPGVGGCHGRDHRDGPDHRQPRGDRRKLLRDLRTGSSITGSASTSSSARPTRSPTSPTASLARGSAAPSPARGRWPRYTTRRLPRRVERRILDGSGGRTWDAQAPRQ